MDDKRSPTMHRDAAAGMASPQNAYPILDTSRLLKSHSPSFLIVLHNMTVPQAPPSLAIVGGGIAGLTLTIALLKHCPHLHVTLYESAGAFGEIGAGVGFENVTVRTMERIDPGIRTALEKCVKGSPRVEPPRWFTVRVGDRRRVVDQEGDVVLRSEERVVRLGEELCVLPSRGGTRGGVHRAHFLDELVKLVPSGVTQFKKKVVDVKEAEDDSGAFYTGEYTIDKSGLTLLFRRRSIIFC